MHAADVIARDLIIVVQTDQRLTELRLVVACEAAAAARIVVAPLPCVVGPHQAGPPNRTTRSGWRGSGSRNVPPRLAHDLLALGIPILVLADPAQLPPPDNRIGYFMQAEPDVRLTEIHRQAADNPILRLADQLTAPPGSSAPLACGSRTHRSKHRPHRTRRTRCRARGHIELIGVGNFVGDGEHAARAVAGRWQRSAAAELQRHSRCRRWMF